MRASLLRRLLLVVTASSTLALTGCSGGQDDGGNGGESNQDSAQGNSEQGNGEQGNGEQGAEDDSNSNQKYPDIVEVEVDKQSADTASLSVTVSSPYDSPERYADGWRVMDQDGQVLSEHTLGHDHANEQPFTRTQSGVTIPAGTEQLTIEGRDQENGYGGETVTASWS
ncbi:MAG: hypothetical protein WA892_13035 [Ornithinimicrobium sp.]